MKNIFEIICKKCRGKCCKTVTFLSQDDLQRLKKCKDMFAQNKKFIHTRTNNHFLMLKNGECSFLDPVKGYKLKEACRPLECLLFPLVFKSEKNDIRFYLNKKCPYLKEISKKWVSETTKWADSRLKHWKKAEKESFSKIIGNHPSSHLHVL